MDTKYGEVILMGLIASIPIILTVPLAIMMIVDYIKNRERPNRCGGEIGKHNE